MLGGHPAFAAVAERGSVDEPLHTLLLPALLLLLINSCLATTSSDFTCKPQVHMSRQTMPCGVVSLQACLAPKRSVDALGLAQA